jgi:repressor LexA
LTARQAEILDWIKRFIREQGIPPTTREIAEGFGMAPPSAADAIHSLVRKGRLQKQERSRRSLRVVETGEDEPCGSAAVSIVGQVAAGQPIEAFEQDMGVIHLDRHILRGREGFALKVVGDSMIEAGIFNGDVVVVRRQDTAVSGDIVVALVNGAATLKRLRVGKDKTELLPANREMQPIAVNPDELVIQGKLVFVSRVL